MPEDASLNALLRDLAQRYAAVAQDTLGENLTSVILFGSVARSEARAEYERLLRNHYGVKADDPPPHHSGRLTFYPTFFNLIDVKVINPHSRKTKAGTHPIYLESVPATAQGTFSLLYVPFDLIGQDEAEICRQAAEDLQLVAEGLQAMFTIYGFSAKRTSGYGVAKERVENGVLTLRIQGLAVPPPETPSAPAPALPRYLEAPDRLKPEYRNPDGTFRERSEAELKAMKKADRQLYEKAKAWWEREGRALAEQRPQPEPAVAGPPPVPTPAWPSRKFNSFDELVNLAGQAAQQLTRGGEG
ncbi:MAG: hypothetical protein ACK4VW_08415 [Anaerolineales bacterium]